MKWTFLLFLPVMCFAQYPQSQSLPDAYMLGGTEIDTVGLGVVLAGARPLYRLEPYLSPPGKDGKMRPYLRENDLYLDILLPRLLADWEAYKAECWNDSTLETWGGGPDIQLPTIVLDSLGRKTIDLTGPWQTELIYIIRSEWTHRKPDPVEFFDKYLTTRLERKEKMP